MIDVSSEIVIDLTECMSNVGEPVPFCGEYSLDSGLLTYPDAKLEKVTVNFFITFTDPDVRVCGKVICFVDGFCDRCLERVRKQIELDFDQIFYKDSAEDADAYVYTNSKLDVTKAVSDEIVLSMPVSLLCSEDCKGLCPKCGTNLNSSSCDCENAKENVFSALKNLKF